MVNVMTSLTFPHCLVRWPVVCLSSRRIATDGWTFDLKCLCRYSHLSWSVQGPYWMTIMIWTENWVSNNSKLLQHLLECPLLNVQHTQPDSCDQLRRSHMTQYRWGYSKLEYRWGHFEGTLQLLWRECCACSSCSVPSKYFKGYSNLQ